MSQKRSHKAKMQALKAEQTRKVKEARDPEQGLVLVYTGNGKGKSSAAFGAMARALGWGHKVAIVQFIKGSWVTGEKKFFGQFKDRLDWYTAGAGFTWDTQDADEDTQQAVEALQQGEKWVVSGQYQLVVLDEINIALDLGYLDSESVTSVLACRQQTSIILTGRGAPAALRDYADLVTDMQSVKHPFEQGIKAQAGIDF